MRSILIIDHGAGIDVVNPIMTEDACVCWEPGGRVGECGAACAARGAETVA